MAVTQALVAIGGQARRLRDGGVDVPVTKSFLEVCGRPALYWTLYSLHAAGIRRVVVAGERQDLKDHLDAVLADLDLPTLQVQLFRDGGFGVHGLPFQARDYLDDSFVFECGHSIVSPQHYRRVIDASGAGRVVFSAFDPHRSNPRQPVDVIDVWSQRRISPGAVAHPFVLDRAYVLRLPMLNYNFNRILPYYQDNNRLACVYTDAPPEFDVAEEFETVRERYGNLLPGAFDVSIRPVAPAGTFAGR